MSDDLIRYDVLLQDALRGVVQRVLSEVQKTGLPGEHHFFIQFSTTAPGVRISSRLREQYPEEMTIVIQHQYWELTVNDSGFEVGLSFGGVPEKLIVPFAALRGFFDPSVQFGLQIDPDAQSLDGSVMNEMDNNETAATNTKNTLAVIDNESQKALTARSEETSPDLDESRVSEAVKPAGKAKKQRAKKEKESLAETDKATSQNASKGSKKTKKASEGDSTSGEEAASADVVSLDSFRKRT